MGKEEQKIYEDEQVSKLLGELKRVDAPNDFDFRVKARIADGKPADKAASWLSITVRYAVPLVLLMLVGGYFVFNALYSTNIANVPTIAEDQPAKVSPVPDLPSNDVRALPSNETIVAGADVKPPETSGKSRLPSPEKKVSPKTERPGGGSIDLSQHEGVKINARIADPNSRSLQISAKNVLALIGITATFNASGWNAVSVRANSIADHSGLRASDVIEAINDQPVSEKTAFANRSTLKSVRVRRDGKSIQIDLNR